MTLPTFSVQQTTTSSSGIGTLTSSGLTIECKTETDEALMESNKNLGTFTIDFKTCKTSLTTEPCHSLGSGTNNLILVGGSWHLVLETLSGADMHYILFLLNPLHIECGTVLISVRGSVLGLIVQKGTAPSKEYTLNVKATGTTQEYTSFENNNGTLVAAGLEAESGGLGFKKSAENSEPVTMFGAAASEILS
jgi:hypothetical protein